MQQAAFLSAAKLRTFCESMCARTYVDHEIPQNTDDVQKIAGKAAAEVLGVKVLRNRIRNASTLSLKCFTHTKNKQKNKLRGPQSESELYRLSDRRLSMKFSANFFG
jgi:hypothetical protein